MFAAGLALSISLGAIYFWYTKKSAPAKQIIPTAAVNTQAAQQPQTQPQPQAPQQPLPLPAPIAPQTAQPTQSVPAPQTAAKTKETIMVGALLGLTGWIQELDSKTLEGLSLRFDHFNKTEEIKGKEIKLVYLDHEYNQQRALDDMKKLYKEYKPQIFIRVVGTEMVKACLDFANENNIFMLFPSIPFSFAPAEKQKNVYFLRNHFENEAKELVNYALKNFLPKKIVLFYQNDEFGKSQLNAAVEKLKSNGFKPEQWLEIGQDTNSANVTNAIQQINDFLPDCIFCFVVPIPGMRLLSGIKLNQYTKILGTTPFNSKSLNEFLKDKGIGITRSYAFPNMNDKSIEISKDYLEALAKINKEPDAFSFGAFISAGVFIEILKQVPDPITAEKIIEKMKTIKNYNYKGFKLNYNEKTKCLSSDLWIETEDGKWIYAPSEG